MFVSFEEQQEKRFNSLLKSVSEIKDQNDNISSSISFLSQMYDDVMKKLKTNENERKENLSYIRNLEEKVEYLEMKCSLLV